MHRDPHLVKIITGVSNCTLHMVAWHDELVWGSWPLHQRGKGLVQAPYKTCAAGTQFYCACQRVSVLQSKF